MSSAMMYTYLSILVFSTLAFFTLLGLVFRRPIIYIAFRVWMFLSCGTVNVLSLERAQHLDGVVLTRDNFRQDMDALPPAPPGQPQNPDPPLVQVMNPHNLVGPYSIHVSYLLKAEGLGSMGQDTADNRRICALRAADIMKKHGLRPSHIARSIPMAVGLAFIPLEEEVAAAQLPVVERTRMLHEAVTRKWVDPRNDGWSLPSLTFN